MCVHMCVCVFLSVCNIDKHILYGSLWSLCLSLNILSIVMATKASSAHGVPQALPKDFGNFNSFSIDIWPWSTLYSIWLVHNCVALKMLPLLLLLWWVMVCHSCYTDSSDMCRDGKGIPTHIWVYIGSRTHLPVMVNVSAERGEHRLGYGLGSFRPVCYDIEHWWTNM